MLNMEMHTFTTYLREDFLLESRGMTPDRIGKKTFTDANGEAWTLSGMKWIAKASSAFAKAVASVDGLVGKSGCTTANCGGVLLVTLKQGRKEYQVGKYSKSESLKMGNDELRPLGFNSAGAGIAKALLRLTSQNFINGSSSTKYKYADKVAEWYTFDSASDLAGAIKGNLKSIDGIKSNPELIRAIGKFLDGGAAHFSWAGVEMESEDRKKLGIYLVSELCCGIWALNGTPFGLPIAKAERFMVPKSTSFSGVDSAFISGKQFVPLSSKQSGKGGKGGGAKPSFFNLTSAWQQSGKSADDFSAPFLKDFYNFISNSNEIEDRTSASQIVYAYGVRKLFHMSRTLVPSPAIFYAELYRRYKKGIPFTKENAKWVKAAIAHIQTGFRDKWKAQLSPSVMKGVPLAASKADEFGAWISSVFTEIIAAQLAVNPLDVIREVGCSKYHQLYLDGEQFISTGVVHFKIVASEACGGVSFTGSKGAQTDISKSNGWVNYAIKGKKS